MSNSAKETDLTERLRSAANTINACLREIANDNSPENLSELRVHINGVDVTDGIELSVYRVETLL